MIGFIPSYRLRALESKPFSHGLNLYRIRIIDGLGASLQKWEGGQWCYHMSIDKEAGNYIIPYTMMMGTKVEVSVSLSGIEANLTEEPV